MVSCEEKQHNSYNGLVQHTQTPKQQLKCIIHWHICCTCPCSMWSRLTCQNCTSPIIKTGSSFQESILGEMAVSH